VRASRSSWWHRVTDQANVTVSYWPHPDGVRRDLGYPEGSWRRGTPCLALRMLLERGALAVPAFPRGRVGRVLTSGFVTDEGVAVDRVGAGQLARRAGARWSRGQGALPSTSRTALSSAQAWSTVRLTTLDTVTRTVSSIRWCPTGHGLRQGSVGAMSPERTRILTCHLFGAWHG
jgi:hypothetical protein